MPDFLLTNAHLSYQAGSFPELCCLLVERGLIQAVEPCPAPELAAREGVEVIDCGGRTLLPGFVDPHCHLLALAEHLVSVDLNPRAGVACLDDLVAKLARRAEDLPPGQWIRGKAYDEFYLAEGRHPNRLDLDRVSAVHPIKLSHRSGHAHALNSLGLKLAGISTESSEPPGAYIDRLVPSGEPSGLLFHMGAYLAKRVPPLAQASLDQGLRAADRLLLSQGITTLHDATQHNDPGHWASLASLKARRILTPRVFMMTAPDFAGWLARGEGAPDKPGDGSRPLGVKIILERDRNILFPDQVRLEALVWDCHQRGLSVAIHAVEEATVKAAAEAIASALARLPNPRHGHRIEHGSVCRPGLAQRLGQLGVGVVSQPGFIHQHGTRYRRTVLPADLDHLYPLRDLLDQGVVLATGSDFPIGPSSPLQGMSSAVTRRDAQGATVGAGQALTPAQAVSLHTSNAAQVIDCQDWLGTLAPGRVADLVLLGGNLAQTRPEEWPGLGVELTIKAGEVVWRSDEKPGV